MGGDTSYDYGASITENRHVWREKYSEEKLEANFFKVSPAYLTSTAGNASNGSYASTDSIAVTPLFGTDTRTNFYISRQANITSTSNTTYKLTVDTSVGNVTIPQLGGQLTLYGRDSKIHSTDYDVGGVNMIYSTADIFTWAKNKAGKRTLILYGGENELHEFAFPACDEKPIMLEGTSVQIRETGGAWVIQWQVTQARQVVKLRQYNLEVHLLWRNDAYNHWVLELPADSPVGNYSSPSKSSVIVRGGYLLRSAQVSGEVLNLVGDLNTTTQFELIHDPTNKVCSLTFDGETLHSRRSSIGNIVATATYAEPSISTPDFGNRPWKFLDSLPEIKSNYDDSMWTFCNHTSTTNPQGLRTPTSLYASDYGYHTGSLIYRAHFVANGEETSLFLNTTGGSGFAHSVWLNETFLGSWTGANGNQTWPQTFNITSKLDDGLAYVITVFIDHMGQDEEAPGTDAVKAPRGILDYNLTGHGATDITLKMTGNLGGEQYRDLARGPRNEGATYAERQGYHLPAPPDANWTSANPVTDGITTAGIGFFATNFTLQVPAGYDVPMSFIFNATATNDSSSVPSQNYRCQLFVNGYQFGKYGMSRFLHHFKQLSALYIAN